VGVKPKSGGSYLFKYLKVQTFWADASYDLDNELLDYVEKFLASQYKYI
jgi:hypothetical protein